MPAASLEVRLHDHRIGTLTALGGDRSIFAFNDAYANDVDRPTLSLSFKDVHGDLIREHNSTQTRLAPFFSNLLPEGPLRDYLARRAGVKSVREYALLDVLGGDLPGAVTVIPAGEDRLEDEEPPERSRSDAAQGPLRFSLAGVQLKFSAVGKAHGGLTIPASGAGGDWIVKLPSLRYAGVSENEFAMMSLAKAMGLDVPEVRLVALNEIEGLPDGLDRMEEAAYAIRRFDRVDGARIHIEDFAQIFGVYPEEKYRRGRYRSIARVLWLEAGEPAVREFIGRLVFNTLIGNADMHLKNWSVIYPDGRTVALSPGYDFVATTAYIPDDDAALRFENIRRMTEVTLGEIAHMAVRAGLPEALALDAARNAVTRFREVWAREGLNLPIAHAVRQEIERLIATVPLAALR